MHSDSFWDWRFINHLLTYLIGVYESGPNVWLCVVASAGVDRKISFAVLGTNERSDSLHSSTTSISQAEAAPTDARGHSARCHSLLFLSYFTINFSFKF